MLRVIVVAFFLTSCGSIKFQAKEKHSDQEVSSEDQGLEQADDPQPATETEPSQPPSNIGSSFPTMTFVSSAEEKSEEKKNLIKDILAELPTDLLTALNIEDSPLDLVPMILDLNGAKDDKNLISSIVSLGVPSLAELIQALIAKQPSDSQSHCQLHLGGFFDFKHFIFQLILDPQKSLENIKELVENAKKDFEAAMQENQSGLNQCQEALSQVFQTLKSMNIDLQEACLADYHDPHSENDANPSGEGQSLDQILSEIMVKVDAIEEYHEALTSETCQNQVEETKDTLSSLLTEDLLLSVISL